METHIREILIDFFLSLALSLATGFLIGYFIFFEVPL
jgi:hypothetical protein